MGGDVPCVFQELFSSLYSGRFSVAKKMQLIEKYRKDYYEAPLLNIIELECAINMCQTNVDTNGSVTIDPDFEEEIIITLG